MFEKNWQNLVDEDSDEIIKFGPEYIEKELNDLNEGDLLQKELAGSLLRLKKFIGSDYGLFLEIKKFSEQLLNEKGADSLALFSDNLARLGNKIWPEDIVRLGMVFLKMSWLEFIYVVITYVQWKHLSIELFDEFYEFYMNAGEIQRTLLRDMESFYNLNPGLFGITIALLGYYPANQEGVKIVSRYLKKMSSNCELDSETIVEIKQYLDQKMDLAILIQILQVRLNTNFVPQNSGLN